MNKANLSQPNMERRQFSGDTNYVLTGDDNDLLSESPLFVKAKQEETHEIVS